MNSYIPDLKFHSLILFSVLNQEEVLLDSEMMSISSKVLKQCTRTLTRNVCSYNHVEFAQKIVCTRIMNTFISYFYCCSCNKFGLCI